MASLVSSLIIKLIANSSHINLQDDAAMALSRDVETRLRLIIQEAMKFAHHSKRDQLTTSDIDNAMRVLNLDPLAGYFLNNDALSFIQTGDTFSVQDKEIDIEKLLAEDLPPAPTPEAALTAHWLAVEGVQPAIPLNPVSSEKKVMAKTTAAPSQNAEVRALVKHVLPRELQVMYDKITSAIEGMSSHEPSTESDRHAALNAALHIIATDAGVQQLVPYWVQFITQQIVCYMHDIQRMKAICSMLMAIVSNTRIHLELYLNQMMPSILTLMLAQQLSENPDEDHWTVRDNAARVLGVICHEMRHMVTGHTLVQTYPTLLPRLSKTLSRAWLDWSRPFPCIYGAIRGITMLGSNAVRTVILPYSHTFLFELQGMQQRTDIATGAYGAVMMAGIQHVTMAVQDALVMLFKKSRRATVGTSGDELDDLLGSDGQEWRAVWPYVRDRVLAEVNGQMA